MKENVLTVKLIKQLIERKNDFEIGEKVEFSYKFDNKNVWNLTLKREENQYLPFIFALEGNRVGTNAEVERYFPNNRCGDYYCRSYPEVVEREEHCGDEGDDHMEHQPAYSGRCLRMRGW